MLKVNMKEYVRHHCSQCEHAATTAGELKRHVGVRNSCSQCDFAETRARNLKIHVEIKHERVSYLVRNVIMRQLLRPNFSNNKKIRKF